MNNSGGSRFMHLSSDEGSLHRFFHFDRSLSNPSLLSFLPGVAGFPATAGTNHEGTRHTFGDFRVKGLFGFPLLLICRERCPPRQKSRVTSQSKSGIFVNSSYSGNLRLHEGCLHHFVHESLSSSPVAVFPHKTPSLIYTGRHWVSGDTRYESRDETHVEEF